MGKLDELKVRYRSPQVDFSDSQNFFKNDKLDFSSMRKEKEEKYKKAVEEKQSKRHELPEIGSFKVHPTMEHLRSMTDSELTQVHQVTIENEFGKISFREPISLANKNLEDCLTIAQD